MVPIQRIVKLSFSGLPLLQLVFLLPRCRQNATIIPFLLHAVIVDSVSTDQRTEYVIDWLLGSQIPDNQVFIPATRVKNVRVLWIFIELHTVCSQTMALIHYVVLATQIEILDSLDSIPHSNLP